MMPAYSDQRRNDIAFQHIVERRLLTRTSDRDGQWPLLDMPGTGDAKHHEINGPDWCHWLREHNPDHAYIELRPGQGVTSIFRFSAAATRASARRSGRGG